MATSVSLIALIPHGNVISELKHISKLMRKESSTKNLQYLPFLPLMYPLKILSSLPTSKHEVMTLLSSLKKSLQDSGTLISLEDIKAKDAWLYVDVCHPVLEGKAEPVTIAGFPSFTTKTGIPLLFTREQLHRSFPQNRSKTEKIRVCTLNVLHFSWNEDAKHNFSWGEFGHIWVKIQT